MKTEYHYKNLIFKSPASKKILKTLKRLSDVKSNIFLIGEQGVGKREIAFLYHKMIYGEDERGFFHISCGNIDSEIGYSTLFGYRKGAFTGAVSDKSGAVDKAKTLYLSSIELLPENLQPAILKLLEKRKYTPLGAHEEKTYNGIIVVSTAQMNIASLKIKLSDSLFYYLNSKSIYIPPLRERREDVIPIAKKKLKELNKKYNSNKAFSPEFENFLKNYNFKGNIRELVNFIEKSFIESDEDKLIKISKEESQTLIIDELIEDSIKNLLTMRELEKQYFLEVFKLTGGNRTKMSKLLGISRKSVYNHLLKYGLIKGKNGKN